MGEREERCLSRVREREVFVASESEREECLSRVRETSCCEKRENKDRFASSDKLQLHINPSKTHPSSSLSHPSSFSKREENFLRMVSIVGLERNRFGEGRE